MKKVLHTSETLPPLTEAQLADLKRFVTMSDDEIETSDFPTLTDAQLAEMKRFRDNPPLDDMSRFDVGDYEVSTKVLTDEEIWEQTPPHYRRLLGPDLNKRFGGRDND